MSQTTTSMRGRPRSPELRAALAVAEAALAAGILAAQTAARAAGADGPLADQIVAGLFAAPHDSLAAVTDDPGSITARATAAAAAAVPDPDRWLELAAAAWRTEARCQAARTGRPPEPVSRFRIRRAAEGLGWLPRAWAAPQVSAAALGNAAVAIDDPSAGRRRGPVYGRASLWAAARPERAERRRVAAANARDGGRSLARRLDKRGPS